MTDPKPRDLQIVSTDSRDHFVILILADRDGATYEVKLNSMDVASLMGAVRTQLDAILPTSPNWGMPNMQRVQYVETPETLYFRVFLSEHQYHEYPVPRDTTLGAELKAFGDRAEAINAAKATHHPPDTPSGKH
jgi:hypothetical protein